MTRDAGQDEERQGLHKGIQETIARLYHDEFRRLFATVVRLIGDFDLSEEALQDAFLAATRQWPTEGAPANPTAWLVSAARFKAIDRIRKQSRLELGHDEHLASMPVPDDATSPLTLLEQEQGIEDDRLRLIFTCCHPAMSLEVRVALTLREICGLATEDIAAAFLLQPATLAQRLVRGKAKIRAAGIPYEVPDNEHLPERLEAVLAVVYLIHTEGYHASSGDTLTRPDLAAESIRLARLLHSLLPVPEVKGLLALMLLNESRRPARETGTGDMILLEQQDRSLWNREQIAEARLLLEAALTASRSRRATSPYTLQAAIAAVHADATTAEATDWQQIAALYELLLRTHPSPVIALNRAVAIAMRDGPEAGLRLIEPLLLNELDNYPLAHAAAADLHRRLNRPEAAYQAYARALSLSRQAPQQRFLRQRLQELDSCRNRQDENDQ